MSAQGRPAHPPPRAAPQLSPDAARGPLGVSHGLQSQTPPTSREASSLQPQSGTPFFPICVSGYHQRKLLLGTAQGGDVPKMPKQHPRTSTLIPPNSSSPSANLPVQGYDPLHESDTLIVEHRRPGKLLKSQDTHKMTLPKDLNYHCEKIRNG